ncbi:hypothetical protein JW721_00640 [Candidatus Micrarchaeota archaeon]|nr:hypothetical protein [Candidatus Micrarchaeota archaeon]
MEEYFGENKTGCCPEFIPSALDGKTVELKKRKFIKGHITSVFHIPLNFGSVMGKLCKAAMDAKAVPKQPLWLSDEKSMWGSEVYFAVEKEVPGIENVELSGTFLTKVFEGEYKEVRNWVKQMQEYAKGKKKEIRKMYFFYTSCPKCAKAYGKNYVVIFAQV